MELLRTLITKKLDIKLFLVNDLKWTPFYSEQDQRSLTMKVIMKSDYEFSVLVQESAAPFH